MRYTTQEDDDTTWKLIYMSNMEDTDITQKWSIQ
jgi:hypothetical protein